MRIVNIRIVERFVRRHSDGKVPVQSWKQKTEAANWNSLVELRKTFNSADYRKGLVIFDIGGNNYRLVAEVNFVAKSVTIINIGTHSDYGGWRL